MQALLTKLKELLASTVGKLWGKLVGMFQSNDTEDKLVAKIEAMDAKFDKAFAKMSARYNQQIVKVDVRLDTAAGRKVKEAEKISKQLEEARAVHQQIIAQVTDMLQRAETDAATRQQQITAQLASISKAREVHTQYASIPGAAVLADWDDTTVEQDNKAVGVA